MCTICTLKINGGVTKSHMGIFVIYLYWNTIKKYKYILSDESQKFTHTNKSAIININKFVEKVCLWECYNEY